MDFWGWHNPYAVINGLYKIKNRSWNHFITFNELTISQEEVKCGGSVIDGNIFTLLPVYGESAYLFLILDVSQILHPGVYCMNKFSLTNMY